jgi:signal transduction histidine kinase
MFGLLHGSLGLLAEEAGHGSLTLQLLFYFILHLWGLGLGFIFNNLLIPIFVADFQIYRFSDILSWVFYEFLYTHHWHPNRWYRFFETFDLKETWRLLDVDWFVVESIVFLEPMFISSPDECHWLFYFIFIYFSREIDIIYLRICKRNIKEKIHISLSNYHVIVNVPSNYQLCQFLTLNYRKMLMSPLMTKTS